MTNYSPSMGRGAIVPIMLFKYLLLKVIYKLSDEDVVKKLFMICLLNTF
ncbi:MAG: hypothetical protein FH753_14300 [Firmicutes bacterium]|nr:hypothetical protein [Bacillota bacterium]